MMALKFHRSFDDQLEVMHIYITNKDEGIIRGKCTPRADSGTKESKVI
jgi:hypothetical protein